MSQPETVRLKAGLYIALAGILLLTLLAYLPTLNNGFLNLDDTSYIIKNELIKSLSLSGLLKMFSSFTVGIYNPLTNLSYALEYHFFGLNPFVFHLTNVILHLLNTALVFFFVYFLSRKPLAALFVSAFFGIHPMHVESVAWATERKDMLFFFFYITGLILYLKYTKGDKVAPLNYLLILIMFAFALLAKPTAVSFPAVLFLIDYFNGRKFSRKLIVEKAPFFALSIIIGVITIFAVRSPFMAYEMVPPERVFLNMTDRLIFTGYALWDYIVKAFLPLQLSIFYPYPMSGNVAKAPVTFYLAAAGCIGLIWFMLRSFRTNRVFVFGSAFFFVTIFFNLPIMTVGYSFGGDRFTYLPYLGIFLIVGSYLEDFYNQRSGLVRQMSYWILAAILVTIAVFSVMTYQRCILWKDSRLLWSDVVKKFPQHPWGYDNLADYYFEKKDYDRAIYFSNAVLELKPEYYTAHYRKGTIYLLTDNFRAALEEYDQAIKSYPSFYHAIFGRGIVHYYLKEHLLALEDFNRALAMYPKDLSALSNRGTVYFEQGQLDKALADFSRIAELDPQNTASRDTVNMIKERIRISEAVRQRCPVFNQ